jgi:predicted Mrr-cat superfamily restriction endonuclease
MTINELIDNFFKHLSQYGLNGDPQQQELYKWGLITKYHDKLDVESPDFLENLSKVNFLNLWFSGNQRTAVRYFVEFVPQEYRSLHQSLYDDNQPLQDRVTAFIEGCDTLWDTKIKQNFPDKKTSSRCDERLISCFLAAKFPEKYTFYKNDVYLNLCDILGVESKKAGQKLVHFYDLLNEKVIPLVKANTQLCEMVDSEVSEKGYIKSLPLTAQTVLWNAMKKKQIWLFYPGDDKQFFDDMVDKNYISIYEWGEIGSLDNDELRTQKGIRNALKEKVDEYKTKEPNHSVKMLYDMKNNMMIGDYLVCRNKDFNKIVAVGEITGGYFYNPDHPVNNHCVEANWNRGEWDITQILKESHDKPSASPRLQNVTGKDWAQKIIAQIENQEEETTMNNSNNDSYIKLLKANKNLILTGAPGTGKTYMAKEMARELLGLDSVEALKNDKRFGFVQFHPSYDYTDFVEGMRPKKDSNSFERRDGVFKEFCKQAIFSESADADTLGEINSNPTVWKVSLEGTGDNPTRTDCMENGYIRIGWEKYNDADFSDYNDYFDGGRNVLRAFQNNMQIGDLVVSCYTAKEIDAVGVITGDYEYHPEGGKYPRYRTVKWLVKNIRENIVDINNNKNFTLPTVYKSNISAEAALKIVKKYSEKANVAPREDTAVFVIDEINRGELSKIFGELFFSIDPGYRGTKGAVKTQYQNLIDDGDAFKEGFYVPNNVYIIGTMNDIDRSVESMDFAMRRRFAWKEVTAAQSYENMIENDPKFAAVKTKIKQRMISLNEAIIKTEGLDKSYQIGAAYFRKYLDYKDQPNPFDCLWENHLEGLLAEYLRGNRKASTLLDTLHKAYNLGTDE